MWRAQRQAGVSAPEKAVFTATERLLGQLQIGELSVAQIVQEAGISRPTFYYYFTSKHAVIAALVLNLSQALIEPFEQLATGAGGAQSRDWRPLIEELAGIYRGHAPVLRAAMEHWREAPELATVWRQSIDRSADLIAAAIDEQRATGIARPGFESGRLARTVMQAVQQAWYDAGTDAANPDVGELMDASEPIFVMLTATLYGDA